jgi:uncharacterized coiled-coil protein SlyX
MTAEELRERLARLETVQAFGDKTIDQHAMILRSHSDRMRRAESEISTLGRGVGQNRLAIEQLKKSDEIIQAARARQKFVKDSVKWLMGAGVVIAVTMDALPNGAARMMFGLIGLP